MLLDDSWLYHSLIKTVQPNTSLFTGCWKDKRVDCFHVIKMKEYMEYWNNPLYIPPALAFRFIYQYSFMLHRLNLKLMYQ